MEKKSENKENELTPQTVAKYQLASDIATKTFNEFVPQLTAGKTIGELCQLGDSILLKHSKTVSKATQNGISFPFCVSVNDYVCHLSPLPSDKENQLEIKDGDTVRIEFGSHVDGYPSRVAHTLVVGANADKPATDKKAKVMKAVNLCAESALRLMKPGSKSKELVDAVDKICAEFECKPVQGSSFSQCLRNVLEGPKTVLFNPPEGQKSEEVEFSAGEVYNFEILLTSGDGKLKEAPETRTTVYRRNPDAVYQLKMKTSRLVFSQLQKNVGTMAFSLRQLEDEKKARMGIIECASHYLVSPYAVFQEKEDEVTAYMVFTVLIMPNGPLRLTSFYDEKLVNSAVELKDEKLVELLKQEVRPKKSKKSKK